MRARTSANGLGRGPAALSAVVNPAANSALRRRPALLDRAAPALTALPVPAGPRLPVPAGPCLSVSAGPRLSVPAGTTPSAPAPTAPPEPAWPPLTTPGPPVGLYVHVPFCVSRCPYCDFAVVAGSATRGPRNRIDAFLVALETELVLRADELDERFGPPGTSARPPLETCYFGGGTPSLLDPRLLEGILRSIADRFGLAPGAEVTLEANPAPDERGDPLAWRRIGITRLSFGGQSLELAELRTLGRRHRPGDVLSAIEEARRAGIASINVDLLYDVPGQTLASFAASLEAVVGAGVDHVSCYALELADEPLPAAEQLPTEERLPPAHALQPGLEVSPSDVPASTTEAPSPTAGRPGIQAGGASGEPGLPASLDRPAPRPGALAWRRRMGAGQDPDRAAAMYELAADRLAAAGYRGYEVSNWARPGHESRHNLLYWTRRPVEALGPGAHAFDGAVRRWTTASLEDYVAALRPSDGGRPRLPPGGSEILDAATARAETWILGLRTDRGLPALAADEEWARERVGWAVAAGLVELTAGESGSSERRIRLTRRGRLLSNEVFVRFV